MFGNEVQHRRGKCHSGGGTGPFEEALEILGRNAAALPAAGYLRRIEFFKLLREKRRFVGPLRSLLLSRCCRGFILLLRDRDLPGGDGPKQGSYLDVRTLLSRNLAEYPSAWRIDSKVTLSVSNSTSGSSLATDCPFGFQPLQPWLP